jgi:hypothetical protein
LRDGDQVKVQINAFSSLTGLTGSTELTTDFTTNNEAILVSSCLEDNYTTPRSIEQRNALGEMDYIL